ncbi:MAG: succinate dehydrogenase, cytochrome b556 subunit [Gammaproteobacteria bacterium]|nr:succinate dehydrogenase, cytochrome b556 subunit [Gammaproteobacteria bacterium]
MKDNRPVNLDMTTIRLPLPALVSILTRASGIFIFVGMAVLIYALDASLASEASFNELKQSLNSPLSKFVMWAIVSGLIYHAVAGVKHMLGEVGVGESLEGGILASKITMIGSIVLILMAGMWIW